MPADHALAQSPLLAMLLPAVVLLLFAGAIRLATGPNATWRLCTVTALCAAAAALSGDWQATAGAAVASLLLASVSLGLWR